MISRRDILGLPIAAAATCLSLPGRLDGGVLIPQYMCRARSQPVERTATIATGEGAAAGPPDFRLEIGPLTWELSPQHRIQTTAYNGQVPGPLLRFVEGRAVTIEITNRTDRPEIVHWHGLHLPPDSDGAAEEGAALIAPGAVARYRFTPQPGGFRWYHTHTMAANDMTSGLYGAQHGPLLIARPDDPGGYDQEFVLTLHDWEGYLRSSDDGSMSPNYQVSSINGKALGAGEPLRVREGQRVLFHILNSSPTEVHWIALAGHELTVVALDGNPVPTARSVSMLRLAPAERVCALVEMNHPGVWVFGEVRQHIQRAGMGIVVEYAGNSGSTQWLQPRALQWNYEQFGTAGPADFDDPSIIEVPLLFEPRFQGHGAMEAWTINGKSYPDTHADPLITGRRYRLRLINRSSDDHPLHLHRHSFELRTLGASLDGRQHGVAVRGVIKDVVQVDAMTQTTVEFLANHPGDTLFHCHQQDHMCMGFMLVFQYA